MTVRPMIGGGNGEGTLEVTRIRESGDTVYSREYRIAFTPVAPSDLDSLASQLVRLGVTREATVGDVRRALEGAGIVDEYHNPVWDTRSGPDGWLWLQRPAARSDSAVRWDVLDPRGEPAGYVEMPIDARIHAVSAEHVWTVENDAMDVPYLVRYRIVGPERR